MSIFENRGLFIKKKRLFQKIEAYSLTGEAYFLPLALLLP
jgi:hypothetical protein